MLQKKGKLKVKNKMKRPIIAIQSYTLITLKIVIVIHGSGQHQEGQNYLIFFLRESSPWM